MIYDLLFEHCPWHTRVALFDPQGRLLSLHHDDSDLPYKEGALVWGVVRKVVPALQAAFVDIGDAEDGFLPLKNLEKSQRNLHEGQKVLVRVTAARSADKGARLDGRVLDVPPAASTPAPALIKPPRSALSRCLLEAGDNPVRIWVLTAQDKAHIQPYAADNKIFVLSEHPQVDLLESLDNQLETLNGAVFELFGGGRLTVEITKALTAMDVDSAQRTGMQASKAQDAAALTQKTNFSAADEVVRLCVLLRLHGNILVDFITPNTQQEKTALEDYVREGFRRHDPMPTSVEGISRFGLMEINRPRDGDNLLRALKTPLYTAGDILLKLWRGRALNTLNKTALQVTDEDVAAVLKKRLTHEVCLAHFGFSIKI